MKLAPRERLVLSAVQHNADASAQELSALTGLTERGVRSSLKGLKARGIIRRIPIINITALGFTQYRVLLSFAAGEERQRERVLQWLVACEAVSFLIQVGGEYEYALILCVRSVSEIVELFDQLTEHFGAVVRGKTITACGWYMGFGRKYLTGGSLGDPVVVPQAATHAEIEQSDHELLQALTRFGDCSERELAERLGVPASTVKYRLRKLKAAGVVVVHIYAVLSRFFDSQSFELLIRCPAGGRSFREALISYCAAHPNIINAVQTIGTWDYQLGIEVEDHYKIPGIASALRAKFPEEIEALEVLPTFAALKVATYPFVHFPPGST